MCGSSFLSILSGLCVFYRKKAEGHVYKLKGKIDYAALMDPKFAEDEEDE